MYSEDGERLAARVVKEHKAKARAAKSEVDLLRQVARRVLDAYDCDDLWVDGEHGAASLRDAHTLCEEWQSKYAIK